MQRIFNNQNNLVQNQTQELELSVPYQDKLSELIIKDPKISPNNIQKTLKGKIYGGDKINLIQTKRVIHNKNEYEIIQVTTTSYKKHYTTVLELKASAFGDNTYVEPNKEVVNQIITENQKLLPSNYFSEPGFNLYTTKQFKHINQYLRRGDLIQTEQDLITFHKQIKTSVNNFQESASYKPHYIVLNKVYDTLLKNIQDKQTNTQDYSDSFNLYINTILKFVDNSFVTKHRYSVNISQASDMLYRGLDQDGLKFMFPNNPTIMHPLDNNLQIVEIKVGDKSAPDPAYTSTSTNKSTAINFANKGTNKGVILNIITEDTTIQGIQANQISAYSSENEITLPRGVQFEVIGTVIDTGNKGICEITVKAIERNA